jgi:hypothetical protein
VLYQGLLYPSVAFSLIGGHIEGNGLCAFEELIDGFQGGQLFQAHDRFHPLIMNDSKDYFRLISCWNQLPPHSRISGSFHIGKDKVLKVKGS